MKITRIKMKPDCERSNNLMEIDSLYITGCPNPGYFKKETVYDHLKNNPGTIQVDIYPYPYVVTAVSVSGEKYVKSSPNYSNKDNLLCLPREWEEGKIYG